MAYGNSTVYGESMKDVLWEERNENKTLVIEAVKCDRRTSASVIRFKPVRTRCEPQRIMGSV